MTRSLRVLYIGLFLVVLLALGAWSLRGFFGFSTNADATVAQRPLDQSRRDPLRRTVPDSSAWAPTSGPRWTTSCSMKAAPA
jgi:hypothetical protein